MIVFTVVIVLVVVTLVVVIAMFRAAEVVFVLVLRDRASQIGAGFLIETEVDASVDPGVADIVSDLAATVACPRVRVIRREAL